MSKKLFFYSLAAVLVSTLLAAGTVSAHENKAEPGKRLINAAVIVPGHQPDAHLAQAIRDNDAELVRQLVRGGADIGLDEQGINPSVRLAVAHGHYRILRYLLEQGAAMETERSRVFRRVGMNSPAVTNILSHITDEPEMLELLLRYGAKPNLTGVGELAADKRPLLVAAQKGHSEAVQILLDYGADPNLGGDSPDTALGWALAHDNRRMLKSLIRGGADVNIFPSVADEGEPLSRRRACRLPATERPLPPLDLALQRGDREFADILRDAGAQTAVQLCGDYS
ncbi:MAG: ankyrin repeat domain-containing protein [Thiolinea sp.]